MRRDGLRRRSCKDRRRLRQPAVLRVANRAGTPALTTPHGAPLACARGPILRPRSRTLVRRARAGGGVRHAAHHPLRRSGRRAPLHRHRGRRMSTAASISAGRASISSSGWPRSAARCACRRRLNVGSLDLIHPELFRGSDGAARERRAADAGACRARLRADLHLRALSDGVSAALRRADRLGRIERDRLRQFGDRRAEPTATATSSISAAR